MNHTYDSLRELAVRAVTFVRADIDSEMEVLIDALLESGVYGGWWTYNPNFPNAKERAEECNRRWATHWALRAVYGTKHPYLAVTEQAMRDHRRWGEERIALRKAGVRFRGTMKRGEIKAALEKLS